MKQILASWKEAICKYLFYLSSFLWLPIPAKKSLSGHLRHRDSPRQPSLQVRPQGPRQDSPVQRIRLHHGGFNVEKQYLKKLTLYYDITCVTFKRITNQGTLSKPTYSLCAIQFTSKHLKQQFMKKRSLVFLNLLYSGSLDHHERSQTV